MRPENADEVMRRLVEAFRVIAATGRADGPRAVRTVWPDFRRRMARRKRVFSPADISRAEEALTWFGLIDDPESRRALQFEVLCKAGGGAFSRVCASYGWKRSTVTCRNRVVLRTLVERLAN